MLGSRPASLYMYVSEQKIYTTHGREVGISNLNPRLAALVGSFTSPPHPLHSGLVAPWRTDAMMFRRTVQDPTSSETINGTTPVNSTNRGEVSCRVFRMLYTFG
ncbi:hypothetical protein Trydic_g7289 [Trypoxylus dichotomus]